MGGGDEDERLAVGGVIFVVFGQATIIGKPPEGSFHDPAFWQNLESVELRALDDLQAQTAAERLASVTSIDPNQTQ